MSNKFRYFVSFTYKKDGNIGWGRSVLEQNKKIVCALDITNIEDGLSKNEDYEEVLIMNYVYMDKIYGD